MNSESLARGQAAHLELRAALVAEAVRGREVACWQYRYLDGRYGIKDEERWSPWGPEQPGRVGGYEKRPLYTASSSQQNVGEHPLQWTDDLKAQLEHLSVESALALLRNTEKQCTVQMNAPINPN